MRRLMLLRHAKTERARPGELDRNRELMKRGRRDAESLAQYMTHHGLIPDLALVSPARRTQQTWTIIADAFGKAAQHRNEDEIYNASTDALLTLIGEPRAARSLLVVGHNPGLHEVALELIASGDVDVRGCLAEKMPTSGFVVIDFAFDDWSELHPQSGRLEHFITPQMLGGPAD